MNSRLYNVRNWPRALQVGKEQAGFNPSVFPGLQHPAPSALCCLLPSYLRCFHFSCSNRRPHTGWLHQQTFIPHSLEVGKTKIKTWWDPLPCLQLTVFLLCPHVRNHLSQVPFIKAPITSNRVPPSSPNHLPKAHLLMSSLGSRISMCDFCGGHKQSVQSVHLTFIWRSRRECGIYNNMECLFPSEGTKNVNLSNKQNPTFVMFACQLLLRISENFIYIKHYYCRGSPQTPWSQKALSHFQARATRWGSPTKIPNLVPSWNENLGNQR